jgi:hypothetical protein
VNGEQGTDAQAFSFQLSAFSQNKPIKLIKLMKPIELIKLAFFGGSEWILA